MLTEKEIHEAVIKGDIVMIQKALNQGFDINQLIYNTQSALHIACSNGHTELVQFLIDHNADYTLPQKYGCTPLRVAVAFGNLSNHNPHDYVPIICILLPKTDNNTDWKEIVGAINILGKRKRLSDADHQLLYRLTHYKNWHIKLAVIQVLDNHDHIPKYVIDRIVELQTYNHPKIVEAVNTFITTHNVNQFNLIETIQTSGSQLWNYLTTTHEEDAIPLLGSNT